MVVLDDDGSEEEVVVVVIWMFWKSWSEALVKGGRKVDGVGGQVIDSGGQFLDFLFFF